jgi:hypothetical protein
MGAINAAQPPGVAALDASAEVRRRLRAPADLQRDLRDPHVDVDPIAICSPPTSGDHAALRSDRTLAAVDHAITTLELTTESRCWWRCRVPRLRLDRRPPAHAQLAPMFEEAERAGWAS